MLKDDPNHPSAGASAAAPEDDRAIQFVNADPASAGARAVNTESGPPEETGAPEEPGDLEIKWHDEDQSPEAGHLFAEVSHEPPPAPFEIVHDPRPPAKPAAAAPRPASGGVRAPEARPPRPPFWVRLFWGFMPLILLLGGYGAVILTENGIGHTWDEAYYYEPAQKAADWVIELLRGNKPFSRGAIDSYWAGPQGDEWGHAYNESPGFQKVLSGLSLRAFPDPKMQLWAMRLPVAILFGLTLMLLYLLGRRVWGPVPGLIAALLYATMPRIFGHAHLAAQETSLIFMMLLTVFCFLRGLDYPFWSMMTGISFGLLLATKINGFFLPIPLLLWAHLYARQRYANNLLAMLTLGPLCFVLAWPWLWPDPVIRTLQYLMFHAQHQKTAVWFWGRMWGLDGPNAPWYYPWVITGVTLPLTAIALGGWGVIRTLLALTRRPIGALYLMIGVTMLLVASAPETPKYDGERLFLPVFPFLALLGGSGAVGIIEFLERLLKRWNASGGRRQVSLRWAAVALGLVVLADGGGAIVRYYPYLLSYYNPLVGGLERVAADRMFETAYWGEGLNQEVITALNNLPKGSSVKTLAMHELCLEQLQNWGILDQDLQLDKPKRKVIDGLTIEYFDYHLLQMRQGFFRRPEMALAGSSQFKFQMFGWGRWEGKMPGPRVPIFGLYKTGPEFELSWRGMKK